MKKLALIFNILFTFTHAFAYESSAKQISEQKLDQTLNRLKKELIVETKLVETLSSRDSTQRALVLFDQAHHKAVKNAKKVLKKKSLFNRFSRKIQKQLPTLSNEKIRDAIKIVSSNSFEKNYRNQYKKKLEEEGGYLNYLNNQIKDIDELNTSKISYTYDNDIAVSAILFIVYITLMTIFVGTMILVGVLIVIASIGLYATGNALLATIILLTGAAAETGGTLWLSYKSWDWFWGTAYSN